MNANAKGLKQEVGGVFLATFFLLPPLGAILIMGKWLVNFDVVITSLLLGFILFSVGLAVISLWRSRRLYHLSLQRYQEEDGLICTSCLYSLGRDFKTGNCPECGEPMDPACVRWNWSILYGPDSTLVSRTRSLLIPARIFTPLLPSRLVIICCLSAVFVLIAYTVVAIDELLFLGASIKTHDLSVRLINISILFAVLVPFSVTSFLIFKYLYANIKSRFASNSYLRCWACAHPIPDTDRGICEHCNTPWERHMLVYAWKRRFQIKDTTADH